ncbi:MAG: cation:proton antiporter [Hellea sp.]|nr:cation:proton antiporter [Hellea sp.]
MSIDIWEVIRNGLAILSLLAGLFFVLGGTLGVLRLPDFFTRLHAAGMTDTLGAELILLGLIIQEGFTQLSLKFFLVAFFLIVTSPTATHAVANAAYQAGLKPLLGKYKAPDPEDIGKEG